MERRERQRRGSGTVGHVSHLTYWDEVGRLAVFQLDPQPVEVLVAPPQGVFGQIELYPCRLEEETHAFGTLI